MYYKLNLKHYYYFCVCFNKYYYLLLKKKSWISNIEYMRYLAFLGPS